MFFRKKNKNKKIINWALVVLWALLIFGSSSIAGSDLKVVEVSDRGYDVISSVVNVFLYLVLTIFLIRAFLVSGLSLRQALIFAFLLAIVYGLLDEFHQAWTPGREVHLSDWLLDVVGLVISLNIYIWRHKLKIIFK